MRSTGRAVGIAGLEMFSIVDSFKSGWEGFSRNKATMSALGGGLAALLFAPVLYRMWSGEQASEGDFFVGLVFSLLTIPIGMSLVWGALLIDEGGRFASSDIFSRIYVVFRFTLCEALYFLIFLIPILAAGIASSEVSRFFAVIGLLGIVWSVQFSLWDFYMLKHDVGPIAALKGSSVLTRGARIKLFVFYVIKLLIGILGLAVAGVGLIVVIPVTTIANAFVYRHLEHRAQGSVEQAV